MNKDVSFIHVQSLQEFHNLCKEMFWNGSWKGELGPGENERTSVVPLAANGTVCFEIAIFGKRCKLVRGFQDSSNEPLQTCCWCVGCYAL